MTAPRKKPKPSSETAKPPAQAGTPSAATGPSQPSAGPGRSELSAAASALPAASTTLDAPALSRTPIASYGDIFRSLPGFNVANYGQGAIGYGLSMRGYTNAEHGRDISYYIDGVPVNDVSSIHTPNYADLNILLPESVKSIEVIRGPFSVECGDSNLGGCINITTKRAEPFASATAAGGSYGAARTVETYSSVGGAFEPFIALEGYHTDGYRDNSFVNRYNSFNKVTLPQEDGSVWSVRVQAYGTTFGAPGYVNRDAVISGQKSPTSATNPTDGGNKYFENIVANYASGATDQELTGTLFVNHDLFNRYATFTGDQRLQQDDRTTIGGRIRKLWTGHIGGVLPAQFMLGGNWRTDVIDTFQVKTVDGAITGPYASNLGIKETNLASFAQLQVKPLPWLKLTVGGRFDQFFYDVTDNLTPANSTTFSPGVTSPKAGISITPVSWLELYANYGQGFRSVDAATELIGNTSIKPFKIESKEVGIQFKSSNFMFLADAWTTDSENESFQAAPGLPSTLLGSTRREGFDLDGRYSFLKVGRNNMSLFANYGGVHAVLRDAQPGFSYVPNVPAYVANVGLDFDVAIRPDERLFGSAYVSFIGKQNLTEDGSLTTSPFTRVTGRLGYGWAGGWTAFSEATWYPGNRLSELAINFGDIAHTTSDQIFVAPVAEFTVLAGLTYRFPIPTYSAPPTTKMVVK